MSDYNSTATSTIYVNGKPAEDELKKLKQRASDFSDALAKAAKEGNKADMKKWHKELRTTQREIKNVENSIHTAENVMKRLNKATPRELNMALKQLKKELNDIERGSVAWNKQVAKIKLVKKELDSVNAEMREQQGILSRLNDSFNKWGMSIAGAAAALTGLTMTVRQAVQAYADMDQEMASVRKFTGMEAEGVEKLNEEFKKMDTRTAREDLNKLAQEAGKLGKSSQEDVLGFVRAADKINVALDELGDGATLTLSKITGIFGDEERLGTEKSLLAVGSVINELSQNCRASAPYLAEFAQRMSGVGSQSGMTVQQIMAFGAVLDSNGQKVESSATALGQVITKLYKEPAKYAKAAGLDVKEFTELLKNDANAAVIQLLETLNNAGNLDALAPMFKEMGENGARSISTLATLAKHIEEVKEQQKVANIAFAEATSIDKEYNVQNNTVQAQLDKAKNKFHELAVELGEKLAPMARYAITGTSQFMKLLSGIITFVSKYKVAILALTSTIVAYTAAVNYEIIAVRAMIIGDKLAALAKSGLNAIMGTGRIIAASLSLAYNNLTRNTMGAAAAQKALGAAMASTPWGAVLAVVGTVVTAIAAFSTSTKQATKSTKDLDAATQHLIFTESEYGKKLVDEKVKIKELLSVAENEHASKQARQSAIAQLNKICPTYNGYLSKEGSLYKANKKALDDYLVSLERRMRMAYYKDEYEKYLREEEAAKVKVIRATSARDEAAGNNNHNYMRLKDKNGKEVVIDWDVAVDREAQKYGISSDKVKYLNTPVGQTTRALELATNEYNSKKTARENFETIIQKAGYSVSDIITSDSVIAEPTPSYGGGGGGGGGGHTTTHSTGGGGNSTGHVDKFAAEKAWRKQQEDQARLEFALDLIDEGEYKHRLSSIIQQYNKMLMDSGKGTPAENLEFEANYYEELKKELKMFDDESLDDFENDYKAKLASTMQDYIDGVLTLEQYNSAIEVLELEHLRKAIGMHKEGSKERLAAEEAYRKRLFEYTSKAQKEYEEAWEAKQKELKEFRLEYFGLSDEEKKTAYDKAMATLNAIYQDELAKLGDNLKAKLELERQYAKAKKAIYDGIYKKVDDTEKESAKTWENRIGETLDKWFGDGTWEKYGETIKGAYNNMMSMYNNTVKIIEAGEQEKLAAVTKKYDAEIRAAEGNQYRIVQLQKRKAAEEKRIKDSANQRAMAMEMAQAVASTALAAINAYKTAPAPVMIWGPIAAGMALAAGAVQIAAIKKSHDAQAQGYSDGGFTKPGAKDEPAGIVHAGEWVASQKLLASPVARPVIEALDYAQRTNTIGRLGTASARRSCQQAAAAAGGPVVVTESQELRSVIKQLNDRLNEPFVTINTVAGPHGIDQAQKDYNKLMNNTLPKNKRK